MKLFIGDANVEAKEGWAVVFSSNLKTPAEGYDEDAERMVELAKTQPGFLGIESARDADGFGITVSYCDSLEAIARWREHAEHVPVQGRGRERYYERYSLQVSRIVRSVSFP
jgi:heme-degrading monooxygenase HmoA